MQPSRPQPHPRSLVLGGGGLVGVAWLVGIATGLAEAGIDLTGDAAPDHVIGTSAGSIVGAHLALRTPLTVMREMALSDELAATAMDAVAGLDFDVLLRVFGVWSSLPDNEPSSLALVGAAALRAPTIAEATYVDSFVANVGSAWPGEMLRCTAVDVASGELRALGAADEIPLARAVAASCSVPGIFPPVTIGPARYTDGGVRSGTNADLLLAGTGNNNNNNNGAVLVLAPMGSFAGDPLDATSKAALEREAALLRAAGRTVTTLLPDDDTNAATLFSPLGRMEPTARVAALEHGARQGRALAAQLASTW